MAATTGTLAGRIAAYYNDREYFTRLVHLAVPVALQNLLANSLTMVAGVMVGQLGDTSLAAVALASQVAFLLSLVLFGIGSGSAMFTAQLWGNKDIHNLRKVLGMCLSLGLAAALLFFVAAQAFPQGILGIFTEDPKVIALGSSYLRIYSWTFLFFSVTSGFASVLRSVGEVRLPMAVTITALVVNVVLSYLLIFGELGFPAMGILGGAVALVVARAAECLALVFLTYRRKLPVAARLNELLGFSPEFIGKIFKPVLPVILNELLWSLAISTYSLVYAHIGTTSIAAMNIVGAFESIAFVPFQGLASAISIMTGNTIGSGSKDKAFRNVGRTLGINASLGILVGLTVFLLRAPVISLYKVSPEAVGFAMRALIIMGAAMIIRTMNTVLVIGMMRSGGDTRYSLFLDGIIIWILGVPSAVLTGLVLHLPVYWVYLAVMSEELVKAILGLRRYFSRKWIHDLTESLPTLVPDPALLPQED